MKKYEGHTPPRRGGKWAVKVSTNDIGELTADILGEGGYTVASDVDNDSNAQLIADAPILAEQNAKMLRLLKMIRQDVRLNMSTNAGMGLAIGPYMEPVAKLIAEVEGE